MKEKVAIIGMGCVFPGALGSRKRYFWLTFDRHNGSDYNWSYGNIHVFESDVMNMGWEWNEKPCLAGNML